MSPFVEPINCARVHDCLEAFVDGGLAGGDEKAIQTHIENCVECAAEHRLALNIRSELRALPILSPPSRVLSEVDRQTRNDERRSILHFISKGRSHLLPKIVAVAAAAVLVVVLSPWSRTPEHGVSQLEAQQAASDARLALAYVADMTRRAQRVARTRVVEDAAVASTIQSVSRSLSFAGGVGVARPSPLKTPDAE